MSRTVLRAGLAGAVAVLVSCSTLPEHAAPKGELRSAESVDLSDTVSYRALTRADFKGTELPAQFGGSGDGIGAATCAYIVAASGGRFESRVVRSPDDSSQFEATPLDLEFRAQMDRKCSWWNPEDLGFPQEYILEHEQIHFAIFELAARRLNVSVATGLRGIGVTPTAANARVEEQLNEKLHATLEAVLERSRDFDGDTSMGHQPEAQKRWLAKIEAELAATGE